MVVYRYKFIAFDAAALALQVPGVVTFNDIGSPTFVDVNAPSGSKSDLDAFMATKGFEFVETSPTNTPSEASGELFSFPEQEQGSILFWDGYWQALPPGEDGYTLTAQGSGTDPIWDRSDENNIFYVGKHGDDSNNGVSIENAFLTFGAAIVEATAHTPSDTNRFSIICVDAGSYVENITMVENVDIYAPNASLTGAISAVDGTTTQFKIHNASSGIAWLKSSGTQVSSRHVVEFMNLSGSAIGFAVTSGVGIFQFGTIFVQNGIAIGSISNNHIHANGEDIYVTGTGTGVYHDSGGSIVAYIKHILDIASGVGVGIEIGSSADTGEIGIYVNRLETTTAYTVASGTLNLTTHLINGVQTQTGGAVKIISQNGIDDVVIGANTPTDGYFTNIHTKIFPIELDIDTDQIDDYTIAFDESSVENVVYVDGYDSGDLTITGIEAPSDVLRATFVNVGANNLIFMHEDTSSGAANRIQIGNSLASLVAAPNDVVSMIYDIVRGKWRIT